jgi:Protein of unknown function (DUF3617)
MRYSHILPIAALLVLGACSSSEDAADAGGSEAEEMAAAAEDGPTPQAGQYRTTMELLEISVPDAPPEMAQALQQGFGQGAQEANTYCVTPEQAAQSTSREEVLKNLADSNCTVDRYDQSGGRIDAALTCAGDGMMSGEVLLTGTMTETGSDMEMSFKMQVPQAGEATMRMHMVSERIGDCS